jgi:hypothetical protein
MRIYIFKSETRKDLRAFAGDLVGSRLPQHHGPWTVTGAIGLDNAPPHNFSRDAIEEAIDAGVSVVASQQEDGSSSLSGLIAF